MLPQNWITWHKWELSNKRECIKIVNPICLIRNTSTCDGRQQFLAAHVTHAQTIFRPNFGFLQIGKGLSSELGSDGKKEKENNTGWRRWNFDELMTTATGLNYKGNTPNKSRRPNSPQKKRCPKPKTLRFTNLQITHKTFIIALGNT